MKRAFFILVFCVLTLSALAVADEGASFDFDLYGYLKLDGAYDQNLTSHGNFVMWVNPYQYEKDDEQFNMTANQSRFGVSMTGNGYETAKVDGKVEFDLYAGVSGGSVAENKPMLQLRHAYFSVQMGGTKLLAGQTWDVISPLVPKTVNYSVAWAQGNIGYRRPQVRFSTWADAGDRARLTLDAAIARNIGADYCVYDSGWDPDDSGDGVDDGADAATPVVQGRLGMSSDFSGDGMLALGVSGHYGEEEYRLFDSGGNETEEKSLSSWSFNTDLTLRINKYACLKGEFFVGENLATYLGGVLQKADNIYDPLRSMGGWGMLSLAPTEKLTVNGGYSFDDPDEEEYSVAAPTGGSTSVTSTFKSMNSLAFGNIMYDFTGNLTGMLEFSYMTTEYATKTRTAAGTSTDTEEFDDLRIQLAIKASIR